MKKQSLLLVSILIITISGLAQSVIKKEKIFNVAASKLIKEETGKPYDLSDTLETLRFIKEQIFKDNNILGDADFNVFLKDTSFEKSAIIFLRHDLDPKALRIFKTDMEEKENERIVINSKNENNKYEPLLKDLNNTIFQLQFNNSINETNYISLIYLIEKADTINAGEARKEIVSESTIFLKQDVRSKVANPKIVELLLSMLKERQKIIQERFDKNQAIEHSSQMNFIEGKEIIRMILHKENNKYSQYLLATKNIVVVILGGEDDLQKVEIQIKHNKKALSQSFNDLQSLVSKLLKGAGVSNLPCRVVLINRDEIIPPSDILIKHTSFKEDIKYVIHEKVPAQFKAGVSFTYLDKKYFKIQNSQLNVSLDSTGKKEFKTNLIAMFDFYPFGRDIDRFDVPVWKFKKSVPFLQRIGLYGGLQISKDPLQGFYYGVSFAPIHNMSINIGGSTVLDPEEQTINVGALTSLNDAKQLLKRKYSSPKLFIGISLSPSDIKKAIFGEDKKE